MTEPSAQRKARFETSALPASLSPALGAAGAFLDGLLGEVYRCANGGGPPGWPLAVIDDPVVARHVLAQSDVFVKNYAFLEALGHGRFTANGSAWRERAALTRGWYGAPGPALDDATVGSVYARHLAGTEALDADALFDHFCAAAVEVFSAAIGLRSPLPWPRETLGRLRDLLRIRQWIDWNGCPPALLADVQAGLAQAQESLRAGWQAEPDARALVGELAAAGAAAGIDAWDAAEELAQNVLASSETTASSLLWIAETLSREPALQAELHARLPGTLDAGAGFIDEVLRLHPPVPLLTRRCIASHRHGGREWHPGDVLAISVVGLQRHPAYWPRPASFEPQRHGDDHPSAVERRVAWMPFSHGVRACAGRRLAMLELRTAFSALVAVRECCAGARPTVAEFGLSSKPRSALRAVPRSRTLS